MPCGSCSESKECPKPVNIFYVWYGELCRRLNMQPLNIVKPARPKSETILDFVCDRVKPEEWPPILNALRLDTSLHVIAVRSKVQCKFLHDVDTEDKARHMKRRAGSLYTGYILKGLVKSLTNCVRRNDVLSSLELDGIPLGIEHVEALLEALKKNSTIKVLTVKYCTLRDLGCQLLCNALKQMPNIEVLNLTGCGLGSLSAQYIAQVVKFQQINRYCESWHNSLRYEDPEVGIMAGLKRITLNNNPNIKDEGLTYILDELDDDLWIKALDMQRCGISESILPRLIDVIDYSRSLEVADFRANDQLSPKSIERILNILRNKHQFGYESEYQWCYTATTLNPEGSVHETTSTTSTKLIPMKSRSVPLKTSSTKLPLRRMKTCTAINKKVDKYQNVKAKTIVDAKKDVLTLHDELQKEMAKRIQSELENKRLKQELERIKSCVTLESQHQKEKVVKFDPIPEPKRVKAKSAKAKANKVEFVFENKTQVHSILQNLVKQCQDGNGDEENEDDVEYFKDILEASKSSAGGGVKEEKEDSSGSNASLIKFMKDIKNEDGNMWSSKCYQSHLSVH
ncbi:PREDICTED: centrosomal protein of 78 kDa [Nicrophorus vespilloides]|uniref:Centrosomal protein of 78 kDa n=1 Tax=Nicrophorus vespilloides TaxID=110193 RepID=A0ABM1M555_NICVS|nr:PREDICTED: centrosomal protein of 78 kDa [Nicrophorus vespilloides]